MSTYTITAEAHGGKKLPVCIREHINDNTKSSFRERQAVLGEVSISTIAKIISRERYVPSRNLGKRDQTISVLNQIIKQADLNSKHFTKDGNDRWVKSEISKLITSKLSESQIEEVAKKYDFESVSFSKIARGVRPYNQNLRQYNDFQKAINELVSRIK